MHNIFFLKKWSIFGGIQKHSLCTCWFEARDQ